MIKKIFFGMLMLTLSFSITNCESGDELSSDSVFGTTVVVRDSLERWLLKSYTYPYNIDFKYKMEDIESDMDYNLVPADSAKAAKLAILIKHLWLESYDEVAGVTFTKTYVPRIIYLVGSAAYNSNNTIVLGTAAGGLKITLYLVNNLTQSWIEDPETLNHYYFKTMHHEFGHILNQKKPYDVSFKLISEASYISGNWYQSTDVQAHQRGFVSAYAQSEPNEDFVENLSIYVTYSKDQWQAILDAAGDDGKAIILKKIAIVKTYMKESWKIDLDELRDVVQRRQSEIENLDLETLK
ncbi:zinc-binding metallopeptidase [Bacteroides ihuae]|uniref:zinc-binding metallopeptidase n=1 Tax=Bacteroides ihuae TaxID=1852362 RepID=UPI000B331541|nr:putative zinc-binding metallopeptidase [Bacteroides ihuae]